MKRMITFIISLLTVSSLSAQSNNVECEDTCSHIHGIDLSHYQGNVFWEAVGQTKMAYVYLKATEGGNHIEQNINRTSTLHTIWHQCGTYHFYRPKVDQQTHRKTS
jgi:lysozyme